MQRASRARLRRLADYGIALVVGGVLVLVVLDPDVEAGPLKALGLALAVVQAVALLWRGVYPERVMAIALAGGLGIQLIAPDGVLPYAGLVALASLAALRPPRVSLPALLGLLAIASTNIFTTSAGETGFALVVTLVPWAFGEIVRTRRVAIEEAKRRAVSEEQARIARELHDVIAHSVSVIVVQAAAANEVFGSRPEQTETALRSIESTGREALQDLRLLLAGVAPDSGADAAHPQPQLDRLEELVEPLRASGLEVALSREGSSRGLPPAVALSAYRIVQEALTNTLRHAGANRVRVTVRVDPDVLELDVLDDGRGSPASSSDRNGRGLLGMRERASMLGGTLEAGPVTGGGYRVRARLPVGAAR